MKTILVTGADGMLGTEVMRLLRRDAGLKAIGTTQADMDITNLAQVRDTLARHRPSHIIHCAAFTFVDRAEKEPLLAYAVNAEGTKNLAFFSRELDIELIYLSTDYVFDGRKGEPYREDERPNPINVYGNSKLLGETYTATLLEKFKVVRTSWLNGLGGDYTRNFIETMLRVSESRSTLSLINDQVGRPTFTFDLAQALVTLVDVNVYGVFHVTNSGQCSWFDFAREVFAVAGRNEVVVRPILSEQFRSHAERPKYSVLENTRFAGLGLRLLPDWRDSLREYFRRREYSADIPENAVPSPRALRA